MYAATSELAVLCRILGHEFPGSYYAPHHRGYGVNALDNYDEMLQVGRVTSCPIRE
jgi:N-acyl-D-amino-acid deacylase